MVPGERRSTPQICHPLTSRRLGPLSRGLWGTNGRDSQCTGLESLPTMAFGREIHDRFFFQDVYQCCLRLRPKWMSRTVFLAAACVVLHHAQVQSNWTLDRLNYRKDCRVTAGGKNF